MIYQMYFHTGRKEEADAEHRYCEYLLGYALFHEKQLIYADQAIIRNKWGKPSLKDHPQIQYNVSHCMGLACCILSHVPVGIDAEYVKPFSPHALQHAFSSSEIACIIGSKDPDRQFFRFWTLKESCVKAMGRGLSYSMKKVVFIIEEHSIRCLTHTNFRFLLLENNSPYITAVCYQDCGTSKRIFMDHKAGEVAL